MPESSARRRFLAKLLSGLSAIFLGKRLGSAPSFAGAARRVPAMSLSSATLRRSDMQAEARIRADFSRVIGETDVRIYGHFIEHLGACVYGGIWPLGEPGVKTLRGMRTDVVGLIKELQPSCMRWPGGCFSEYYHWEDGIGPVEKRPWRFDWSWKKPEPNLVGTHEFIVFCREVGAEPVVAVNVRTGTPEEAAAWVQYCNGPATSHQGRRRAQHGHPEPFGVRIWDIGNESWDMGAEESARRFLAFHKEMKKADPTVKLVAVGSNQWDENWNRTMLSIAGEALDYIAPHHYDGWGNPHQRSEPKHHYANVASFVRIAHSLQRLAELLDEMLPHRPEVGIAMDEWGIWTHNEQGIQHDYDLSDALTAACIFNAMHRLCRRLKMANWAQLVNVLGLIQAHGNRSWPTPVHRAFKLYRSRCIGSAVECQVESSAFDVDPSLRPGLSGIPYLDASAIRRGAWSAKGARPGLRGAEGTGPAMVLAVVNTHAESAIETRLELAGVSSSARLLVEEINGPSVFAHNGPDSHDTVGIQSRHLDRLPETYSFPPHSITVMSLGQSQ
jgi:alpha-N-arabinofuranosidase